MDKFSPEQLKQMESMIRKIYWEEFNKNYYSGVPRIPPHRHNGIDNLVLESSGGGGTPAGGNTAVQFNNNGEFGGDPEGSVNFAYDQSTFTLGIPNITNAFPTSPTGITGDNQDLNIYKFSGGGGTTFDIYTTDGDIDYSLDTDPINIFTGNADTSTAQSGDITIRTGDGQTGGNIIIETGTLTNANQGDIDINADNDVSIAANSDVFINGTSSAQLAADSATVQGNDAVNVQSRDANAAIQIRSSIALSSNNDSGDITIETGATTGTGTTGAINIQTGSTGVSGASNGINIIYNNINSSSSYVKLEPDNSSQTVGKVTLYGQSLIMLTNQVGAGGRIFLHTLPSNAYTGLLGQGVIYIGDATDTPTDSPVDGGLLYVDAGALKFKGSGGTVTTIAPA